MLIKFNHTYYDNAVLSVTIDRTTLTFNIKSDDGESEDFVYTITSEIEEVETNEHILELSYSNNVIFVEKCEHSDNYIVYLHIYDYTKSNVMGEELLHEFINVLAYEN